MVFFDIAFIALISLRKKNAAKTIEALSKNIFLALIDLDKQGQMDPNHLKELQKKLQNPIALQNMELAIDSLTESLKNDNAFVFEQIKKDTGESIRYSPQKYALLFDKYRSTIAPHIVALNSCYSSKDIEIYSYYIYFLRKYKLLHKSCSQEILSSFKDVLENGDVHACENVLLTIYDLGKPDLAIDMLKLFDKSDKYLNPKIITDGMLDYSGNAIKFQNMLITNFKEFSSSMQVNILNYIRFASGDYCEFMLQLLLDEQTDDEVKFACLRYFGKYKYAPAYPIIVEYANGGISDRKEFQIIAVAIIRNYPDAKTIDILKKQVYSLNWNIRYNAAESLDYLGVTYEDVMDILENNDRYTREMIQYRFDERYAKEKEEVFL
jgi:hypothetical protein